MKYSFFIVEGYEDLEVVARLLKIEGFSRKKTLGEMDPKWRHFFPKPELTEKSDLTQRPRIPAVFETSTHSILVSPAGGFSKIKLENINLVATPGLTGFCVIVDTDPDKGSLPQIFSEITAMFPSICFPKIYGEIQKGNPNAGVFLLPDNANVGSLESILWACSQQEFPAFSSAADAFISSIPSLSIPGKELAEFNKPFGRMKATIGVMGNVFRPGKSIQVSIHDNPWVSSNSLSLPMVAQLWSFIKEIAEI